MDFKSLGNTSVIGLQWGDEGKGKIVDLLTEHFDMVVRYAGGANAGHTVRIGAEKFALHLVPSGILRKGVLNVVGPGVAVDFEILHAEIEALRARGIEVADNLRISNRAHLVMPYHKKQDRLTEAKLGISRQIGTTAKGIGPCYADKMLRSTAFRVGDLEQQDAFRGRLLEVVEDRNKVFAALYADREPLDARQLADQYLKIADALKEHFADTTSFVHAALDRGDRILFEGAQGSLLDLDHGTFPYVTSSTCTSGGVAAGAGVPPSAVQSYIGVIKAYSTRVGSGPFPTELKDAIGDRIRERGHEYGTTTGRPRRCGWFDAFATRYTARLSGITQIAVMHLDTLGAFPEVLICTGYRHRGAALGSFTPDVEILDEVEPICESMQGWQGDFEGISEYEKLPHAARRYIDRLEVLLETPITLVSVGAERTATLHRKAGG
ncbi:MAG TPA: adenylosuccinate synthase [Phycisphaerae bacterium]|nr:adenylosuccinate synthase [Phycisphaerae bacterium]